MKKIVIAGGTGFLGTSIATYFARTGTEVVILTRGVPGEKNNTNATEAPPPLAGIRLVLWDALTLGDWTKEIYGADILINLCGKTVNCRYTRKNRQAIIDSRILPTQLLGAAIQNCTRPPKLWINASSATIYRHAMDKPQDELTGETEDNFSVQVCKQWEEAFFRMRTPFTRKVALRMAITLGSGGILKPYFNLVKWGLGGRQGSGKQMYSWVHIEDTCRIIAWLLEQKEMEGVYNCSSPEPVSNDIFMKTIRKHTGHFCGLPLFTWMLKLGAAIAGSEPELVLKSRWVVPTKLTASGFAFKYTSLDDAIKNIVANTAHKQYHLF